MYTRSAEVIQILDSSIEVAWTDPPGVQSQFSILIVTT
jgi:hypothetical protein